MEELGMFEGGTLAAHCVHVDEADQDILARHGVRVAHNPQSNLKLASGIAPVASMLKKRHHRGPGHRRPGQQQSAEHVYGNGTGRPAPQTGRV